MAKKDDLKAELTRLGITFDDTMTNVQLEALLPADNVVSKEPEDAPVAPEVPANGIVVSDPQVLRPVELPLVIKPIEGQSWKNTEQEAYAKVLNAAAYARPAQWAIVKDAEIARLVEIGTNPDKYYTYTGTMKGDAGNFTIKNNLLGE